MSPARARGPLPPAKTNYSRTWVRASVVEPTPYQISFQGTAMFSLVRRNFVSVRDISSRSCTCGARLLTVPSLAIATARVVKQKISFVHGV